MNDTQLPEDLEVTTLKEDVAIDISSLEYEWTRQSSLYMKWSIRLGQCIDQKDRLDAQYDRVKRQMERKKSELNLLSKRDPRRLKLPEGTKPTVDIINAWVLTNEEIVSFQDQLDSISDEMSKVKKNIEIFTAAQTALVHKKKSLEMLTEMILSGYYTDPRIPKEARDKVKAQVSQQYRENHQNRIAQSAARRMQSREDASES